MDSQRNLFLIALLFVSFMIWQAWQTDHAPQPANQTTRPQAKRLHAAIVEVLTRSIALGGSTLRDFVQVNGYAGAFQAQASVYGRAGEPCPQCGQPVQLIKQGQRSTYYCNRCQK